MLNKLKRFLNKHETVSLVVFIVVVGLFLRLLKVSEWFAYGQDQDLLSWFVKDVVSGRFRLIGQETSTNGIFIGPAYYYFMVPFYVLFRMDPIGATFGAAILGVFGIVSTYYVFSKIFESRTGIIASILYSISFYTVLNDRETVPTQPVITWGIWFLFCLYLLSEKKLVGYFLLGVLAAFVWHLNMALILLFPLVPLTLLLWRQRISIKGVFISIATFVVLSLPLIAFELRHNFIQVRAFIDSLTSNQQDILHGIEKVERVIHLSSKDLTNFIVGSSAISYGFWAGIFALVVVFVFVKYRQYRKFVYLFSAWIILVIGFFSLYSKILSEYYLNSLVVVFIAVFALFINYLFAWKKKAALFILLVFVGVNLYRFVSFLPPNNGYSQRMAIVKEIKADMDKRGFTCVDISYITNPGYEFGYRYFFYYLNIRANKPVSGAPLYSIVFPLKRVDAFDKSFGGLGLIYPTYKNYTAEGIQAACVGDRNDNITGSLWGYPQ